MRLRVSKIALVAGLGLAMAALPIAGHSGMFGVDQAFAKNGNGGGHGGGNGGNSGAGGGGQNGGGGKSHSQHGSHGKNKTGATSTHSAKLKQAADVEEVEDTEDSTTDGTKHKGKNLTSKLGALNAAHASANAFAHASPNSRIGRIRAYAEANAAAKAAESGLKPLQDDAAAKTSLAEAAAGKLSDAQAALQKAQDDLAGNPQDAGLQQAVTDAQAAVTAAKQGVDTTAADAAAAQTALDTATAKADELEKAATDALNAAANKTPVDEDTRAALDKLLEGKIATTVAEPAPTDPVVEEPGDGANAPEDTTTTGATPTQD